MLIVDFIYVIYFAPQGVPPSIPLACGQADDRLGGRALASVSTMEAIRSCCTPSASAVYNLVVSVCVCVCVCARPATLLQSVLYFVDIQSYYIDSGISSSCGGCGWQENAYLSAEYTCLYSYSAQLVKPTH